MNARIERRRVVTKTVSQEEVVILEMSRDEAQALRAILGKVGGHPDRTRRGLVDNIASRLHAAGLPLEPLFPADLEGGITCRELRR